MAREDFRIDVPSVKDCLNYMESMGWIYIGKELLVDYKKFKDKYYNDEFVFKRKDRNFRIRLTLSRLRHLFINQIEV